MSNWIYLTIFSICFGGSIYYLRKFTKQEDRGGIIAATCSGIINTVGWLITFTEILGGV